jgi:hypothetical protein
VKTKHTVFICSINRVGFPEFMPMEIVKALLTIAMVYEVGIFQF